MNIVTLSWRNVWRNRRRTLITLSAISFGIMLVQGFHNLSFGVYEKMIESGVRSGSGHLTIYQKDYNESRDEKLTFAPAALIEQLQAREEIELVVPRIYLPGLAQSSRESRGVLLIGVEPELERQVNPFLRGLSDEQMLRNNSGRDAIIGSKLLKELKLKEGRKFVVTVQGKDAVLSSELFRIRGVVTTGIKSIDSSLVMVGAKRATQMTGKPDEIHELAIILPGVEQIEPVKQNILPLFVDHPELDLLTWEEAMSNLANAIKLDYASQNFIFLIIIVIVGIGVVNTMLMSVMERFREFGTILALGASPTRLRLLVLCEAMWLGIVATLTGLIFGCLLTWYLATVGIDIRDFVSETMEFGGVVFEPIIRATWDYHWMLLICVGSLSITVLAACYPAWRAGRVEPVKAMRHH